MSSRHSGTTSPGPGDQRLRVRRVAAVDDGAAPWNGRVAAARGGDEDPPGAVTFKTYKLQVRLAAWKLSDNDSNIQLERCAD
jgi:hypothetical protein